MPCANFLSLPTTRNIYDNRGIKIVAQFQQFQLNLFFITPISFHVTILCTFYPENGGKNFLQNTSTDLPNFPPVCWYLSAILHDITPKKTAIFVVTTH